MCTHKKRKKKRTHTNGREVLTAVEQPSQFVLLEEQERETPQSEYQCSCDTVTNHKSLLTKSYISENVESKAAYLIGYPASFLARYKKGFSKL